MNGHLRTPVWLKPSRAEKRIAAGAGPENESSVRSPAELPRRSQAREGRVYSRLPRPRGASPRPGLQLTTKLRFSPATRRPGARRRTPRRVPLDLLRRLVRYGEFWRPSRPLGLSEGSFARVDKRWPPVQFRCGQLSLNAKA